MTPPKRSRRKGLSKDDIAVWRHVAQSITPLDQRRACLIWQRASLCRI